MRHGSLFSGIGGFDLAAEWMGWENVFHCEINGFCQQVLKQHWPTATLYKDIKTTSFEKHNGSIDIISGGFPCQPYSTAGKRKGKEDDRHLWPEMLRAIREIQPKWVVGENVRGLINWNRGVVFDEVQADLENEGYEITPFLLPACGVNASHRRDRVWFIAHSNNNEHTGTPGRYEKESKREGVQQRDGIREFIKSDSVRIATDTDNIGREGGIKGVQKAQERGYDSPGSINGELRYSRFKDGLPTPRIFGADDGIPNGVDRVKALGNAVVPQVVYQIFKAIEQYELIGGDVSK